MAYSEIFIWYCCIVGMLGNVLACILLVRRLMKFKTKIFHEHATTTNDTNTNANTKITNTNTIIIADDKLRASNSALPTTSQATTPTNPCSPLANNTIVYINKSILLDLNHNWTVYLYFIGIMVSDIAVLFNWILSKLTINYETNFRLSHNLDFDDTNEAAFLPYNDYQHFATMYQLKNENKHPHDMLVHYWNQSRDEYATQNGSYFVALKFILNTFDNQTDYLRIKFIDLQVYRG